MQNLTTSSWLGLVGAVALLGVAAWLADTVTTRIFRAVARRVASRTRSTWDDRIIERRVFAHLAHVVPALIVYYAIGPALRLTPAEIAAGGDPRALTLTAALLQRVSLAFIVVTMTMAVHAFLTAVNDIYNETYAVSRSRPIKGYLQVISIALFIAAGLIVVALLANRSPVVLLSGLGALTAVLLLVFRDTILSLVASLQIASNDMIRIGDWVEMPQANADGDVIDVALHTVKIQNWDKTITTIPTHRFISESFRNWRGMSESGGRRIKRALYLDVNSVRFLTEGEIDRLGRYEFLRDYMRRKRQDIAAYCESKAGDDPDLIPEPRRLTNVGTFRAYVLHYLKNHPRVHHGMTTLVRQLEPGPEGLPLQIYCFSSDTEWASYEALQSDIFDHLLAILPEFGLRTYQYPSGADLREWVGKPGAGLGPPPPA